MSRKACERAVCSGIRRVRFYPRSPCKVATRPWENPPLRARLSFRAKLPGGYPRASPVTRSRSQSRERPKKASPWIYCYLSPQRLNRVSAEVNMGVVPHGREARPQVVIGRRIRNHCLRSMVK